MPIRKTSVTHEAQSFHTGRDARELNQGTTEGEEEEDYTFRQGYEDTFHRTELLVPLNDLNSTTASDRTTPRQPAASIAQVTVYNTTPGQNVSTEEPKYRDVTVSLPLPIDNTTFLDPTNPSQWDFTVPVVDHSQVRANDMDEATPTRRTSKVQTRVSTPYRAHQSGLGATEEFTIDISAEVEISRGPITPRRDFRADIRAQEATSGSISPVPLNPEVLPELDIFDPHYSEWYEENEQVMQENVMDSPDISLAKSAGWLRSPDDFEPGLELDLANFPAITEQYSDKDRRSSRSSLQRSSASRFTSNESEVASKAWRLNYYGEVDFGFSRWSEYIKGKLYFRSAR
jgi:hypothetical protein